ncbi:hypothetical protein P3S67_008677 [Capsicum chacoense]
MCNMTMVRWKFLLSIGHRWKTDSLNPTRFRVELSGIQTRATSRIYNFQVHTMELANGDVACDAYHKYKEFNHDDLPQALEDEYGGWPSQNIMYTGYFPPVILGK